MGTKGQRRSDAAEKAAKSMAERLAGLGSVRARGMFGGYGLFADGVMFGLVDTKGVVHLRADERTASRFQELGSVRHGKMPYFTIPEKVLATEAALREWATEALELARAKKSASAPKRG